MAARLDSSVKTGKKVARKHFRSENGIKLLLLL
jgi:hypothetical protein